MPNEYTRQYETGRIVMTVLEAKHGMSAAILRFLSAHMNPKRNGVVISTEALSEIFGVSRRTIERAVKVLKDNNFIKVVRTGRSNVYFVNAKIIRSDKKGEQTYFNMNASVLLSCSEMKDMASHMKKMEYSLSKDIDSSLRSLFSVNE